MILLVVTNPSKTERIKKKKKLVCVLCDFRHMEYDIWTATNQSQRRMTLRNWNSAPRHD